MTTSAPARAKRVLRIEHDTLYRYRRPVTIGPHRLMIRPRDSHDLRLLDTGLTIDPPARVTWIHDVFGNSVGIATIDDQADHLKIGSVLQLEHYPSDDEPKPDLLANAVTYPFEYDDRDLIDLGPVLRRHYPDPHGAVERWARAHLDSGAATPTLGFLRRMCEGVKADFRYNARYEEGTQQPAETLATRSGTCRDFALLMMEGLRALGLATRFVSGYLYNPRARSEKTGGVIGGGATHAWMEVYLPGAGWVEFDPTNGIIGGLGLVRVAVARDPAQAIPIGGTWSGDADDFIDLEVTVTIIEAGGEGGDVANDV
ncbi:MAG: transglutaminase family protein [Rhodospirillales bacterium]|nr:transglutaminase family protein [Rhodospirillales bacterium]